MPQDTYTTIVFFFLYFIFLAYPPNLIRRDLHPCEDFFNLVLATSCRFLEYSKSYAFVSEYSK